jgi:cell division ATPase FtsA
LRICNGLENASNVFGDSDVTKLLFFKDGYFNNIRILATGSDALTAGLVDTLNIPWDLATDIKVSYGVIGEPSRVASGRISDQDILPFVNKKALHKIKEVCSEYF